MNQRQARALLELMADLYVVANTPEETPRLPDLKDVVIENSKVEAKK